MAARLSGAHEGGAGRTGAPRPPAARSDRNLHRCAEQGTQTLEFALVVPLIVLLLVLVVHAGLLSGDMVAAQGLAREAARVAAVSDDQATRAALSTAAGRQAVAVTLRPASPRTPGTLVTAQVRLRSRAFRPFGVDYWVPARATMRVEDR